MFNGITYIILKCNDIIGKIYVRVKQKENLWKFCGIIRKN